MGRVRLTIALRLTQATLALALTLTLTQVWDSNEMVVESQFDLPAKVLDVALSPAATSHSLLAVACDASVTQLQLGDLRRCVPCTPKVTLTSFGR